MFLTTRRNSLLDHFFNSWDVPTVTYTTGGNYHSIKNETGYHFEMLVPGSSKENVKVTVEGENLKIKCKYESDFHSYDVDKSFSVPEGVEASKIKATVEDGILKINLPFKKKEKEKNIIEVL